MNFWKKTLPFLLLNILVSAVTIIAVIYFFGPKILSMSAANPSQAIAAQTVENTEPTRSSTNTTELNMMISAVIGAGDLETESVLFKNQGKATANLLNWTLTGKRGQTYIFPDLTLKQGGTIRLNTKSGTNTVLDLFANQSNPIWKSGDILTLKDASGKVQTSFQVP